MNKAELLDALVDPTGQAKADISQILDAFMETVGVTLAKGDKVQMVGFGTFEPQHRAARAGRNPQTGAAIEIAEATLPKFTPGKVLKERVAEAHKPLEVPAAKPNKKK